MAKRPSNLVFGVEDKPPRGILILLAVQHVCVISVGWVFIVVIVNGIGGTAEQAEQIIQYSMIASGTATMLQARNRGIVGSGYLCPLSSGPAYIGASILAGKEGGFALVFGLTAIAGIFETLLSRLVRRLRVLFPPEVTGLVVTMVGIELIRLAVPRFVGYDTSSAKLEPRSAAVALLTLTTMIVPSLQTKGNLKLYPVLFGIVTGYLAAYATGLIGEKQFAAIEAVSWISLPGRVEPGWSFSATLLPAFLIAGLASTLKSIGDLTLCQKINDTDWKRTDMKSVSGGILAGSFGTVLAGLLGGTGQTTFSSNVGLSIATGATSRFIAFPCGIMLIVLAFFPKLAMLFAMMPGPVMGAMMIYVACFMIVGGIQVITSRMLDTRRTFVLGISFVFGLSVELVPEIYADMPKVTASVFSSALSLSTLMVVLLHLLFRVGVKRAAHLQLSSSDRASDKIFAFMETQGANWGARKEVIVRVITAMNEFAEGVRVSDLAQGDLKVVASFDEFNLDVEFSYQGKLLQMPDKRPSEADLIADEKAIAGLAGFLVRNSADRIHSSYFAGVSRVQLHFDH